MKKIIGVNCHAVHSNPAVPLSIGYADLLGRLPRESDRELFYRSAKPTARILDRLGRARRRLESCFPVKTVP